MRFHYIDIAIIGAYLVLVSLVGFAVRRAATKNTESYFLAGRNVPWWMLGLAGCSSYIDIGGTMAIVGMIYYLGLKSLWGTHIIWGLMTMALYMAYQAKYIRRSGVATFAEWNATRFGDSRDAEFARLASAVFLLVLMVFNMMFTAVGTGKFAAEFLPLSPVLSSAIVFAVVGVYVTLGGFFGVIITDLVQTVLILLGALALGAMAFAKTEALAKIADMAPGWSSLAPTWTLWSGFADSSLPAYKEYYLFGPLLMAGAFWAVFRLLSGPNVWDFQFFLTLRNARDASLSAGMWVVGYTMRWVLACAFVLIGICYFAGAQNFDAERLLPQVLWRLPVGVRGAFIAVMLAALMSSISALINVTSSSVINDFVRRYIAKNSTEKQLVRIGQIASAIALMVGLVMSVSFSDIVSAWQTMIYVVVTMILVPATMRWHWWRFGPRAFVYSMIVSALVCVLQKAFLPGLSTAQSLFWVTFFCLVSTVAIGFLNKPADMDVLVRFYSNVRPFGVWGPVRVLAVKRGLVPADDRMPTMDMVNGVLCCVFQFCLATIPFYLFLRHWAQMWVWLGVLACVAGMLYFTWYKNLPVKD